jgi:hypothetical protein
MTADEFGRNGEGQGSEVQLHPTNSHKHNGAGLRQAAASFRFDLNQKSPRGGALVPSVTITTPDRPGPLGGLSLPLLKCDVVRLRGGRK